MYDYYRSAIFGEDPAELALEGDYWGDSYDEYEDDEEDK